MKFKFKLLICILVFLFSLGILTGCCGVCTNLIKTISEQINKQNGQATPVTSPDGNVPVSDGNVPVEVPTTTTSETGTVRMDFDEINENGVPPSTYVEIEGWPSYYDMVYTYYYEGDPNNITEIDDIYYPILSEKQYDLYSECLVERADGTGFDLNIDKAKQVGLTFRVFIRHKESTMDFIENPPEETWTVYRGIAKSGSEIDVEAMDILKSGEIGPLLHPDLILIYME